MDEEWEDTEEEEDEFNTYEARKWDDYKETYYKGFGNTLNSS
jgi:hypothetical protein